MNPYKEDGPRARLSFDPAYCKRCTGPPSVNDGYITGPGCRTGRRKRPKRPTAPVARPCGNAPPHAGRTRCLPRRHAKPAAKRYRRD
ncbi:hypothetical protein BSTAB16_1544 [Burkholderia stabilis]|uniref:Uncharacterized protein n=1 Tax=Burkholderia stabilis TaxID=95485 RepID=A0AAJ5N4N8_9BURK|nr:hypothetical protein BSTAB16_1544 [Burkholderia stabilis]